MKAIQILENQLEELLSKRTRMAEKGLDSAVIGLNQAVRDAREAVKCAQHGASTIDAEYCIAVERNGTFVYAYPLPGAKTLAGAKRAAAVGGISGTMVLFRESAEVGRREGKRWEIASESSTQKKRLQQSAGATAY